MNISLLSYMGWRLGCVGACDGQQRMLRARPQWCLIQADIAHTCLGSAAFAGSRKGGSAQGDREGCSWQAWRFLSRAIPAAHARWQGRVLTHDGRVGSSNAVLVMRKGERSGATDCKDVPSHFHEGSRP